MNSNIKKYWLLSSILYFTYELVDAFLVDSRLSFNLQLGSLTLLIPFGYLFIEVLNFVGLFLFSYKKKGTGLLTLNMGLSIARMCALSTPFWLWQEFVDVYATRKDGQLLIDSIALCVCFLIVLQWLVFSFKLRKENKLISENEILSHPEHLASMQDLKAVSNLDDLLPKYGECVRNYPQIASALKKIYKQRRLDLN